MERRVGDPRSVAPGLRLARFDVCRRGPSVFRCKPSSVQDVRRRVPKIAKIGPCHFEGPRSELRLVKRQLDRRRFGRRGRFVAPRRFPAEPDCHRASRHCGDQRKPASHTSRRVGRHGTSNSGGGDSQFRRRRSAVFGAPRDSARFTDSTRPRSVSPPRRDVTRKISETGLLTRWRFELRSLVTVGWKPVHRRLQDARFRGRSPP